MKRRDFIWQASVAAVGTYLAGQRAWVQGLSAAPLPTGALDEMPALRTMSSKTFDLGGGRRRILLGMRPKHAPADPQTWQALAQKKHYRGAWHDLNYDKWDEIDGRLVLHQGWYSVSVDPRDPVAIRYTSTRGGTVEMRMTGLPLRQTPPLFIPEGLRWENVAPDFDVELHLKVTGVEWFKRLKSARAPRSWGWSATESPHFPGRINWHAVGWDNADATARQGEELFYRRHRQTRTQMETARRFASGRWVTEAVESWTGLVVALEPVTRIKALTDDVVYPVWIDADINEVVTADGDDVEESQQLDTVSVLGNSYGNMARADVLGYGFVPGWRWAAVAFPSGATVDLATIRVQCSSINASGVTGTVKFDEVADAAVWTNTSRPTQISATAGTATLALTSTGLKSATVTSDIAELATAGLATGNDIRAGLASITGDGADAARTGDLTGSAGVGGDVEAVLEIDYTEGGGAVTCTRTLLGVGPC